MNGANRRKGRRVVIRYGWRVAAQRRVVGGEGRRSSQNVLRARGRRYAALWRHTRCCKPLEPAYTPQCGVGVASRREANGGRQQAVKDAAAPERAGGAATAATATAGRERRAVAEARNAQPPPIARRKCRRRRRRTVAYQSAVTRKCSRRMSAAQQETSCRVQRRESA